MPKIVVDKELCKACELCSAVCPKKILELGHELNSKGSHYMRQTDEQACIGCKLCAIICPDLVISVFK